MIAASENAIPQAAQPEFSLSACWLSSKFASDTPTVGTSKGVDERVGGTPLEGANAHQSFTITRPQGVGDSVLPGHRDPSAPLAAFARVVTLAIRMAANVAASGSSSYSSPASGCEHASTIASGEFSFTRRRALSGGARGNHAADLPPFIMHAKL
jgi:hypothetical protein